MNNFVNEIYSQTQSPSSLSQQSLRRSSSSAYFQNKSNFICFNNHRFYIPNIIPILDWRSYWMKRFFQIETEQSKRHHKFPVKLKSGLLYNSNDTSHGNNSSNISIKFFKLTINQNTIKQIYKNLVNYYLDYTNLYYEIEKEIIVLVDCDDFYLKVWIIWPARIM